MPRPNQPDLFSYLAPTVNWSPGDRQIALMLLRELLQEAVNEPGLSNASQNGKEARNEQDYG